jgi:hypothetical protein
MLTKKKKFDGGVPPIAFNWAPNLAVGFFPPRYMASPPPCFTISKTYRAFILSEYRIYQVELRFITPKHGRPLFGCSIAMIQSKLMSGFLADRRSNKPA